jgi:hypothetical protein
MCCENGSGSELHHSVPYRLGSFKSDGLVNEQSAQPHPLSVATSPSLCGIMSMTVLVQTFEKQTARRGGRQAVFFQGDEEASKTPRVITLDLDGYAASHRAVTKLKAAGTLPRRVRRSKPEARYRSGCCALTPSTTPRR